MNICCVKEKIEKPLGSILILSKTKTTATTLTPTRRSFCLLTHNRIISISSSPHCLHPSIPSFPTRKLSLFYLLFFILPCKGRHISARRQWRRSDLLGYQGEKLPIAGEENKENDEDYYRERYCYVSLSLCTHFTATCNHMQYLEPSAKACHYRSHCCQGEYTCKDAHMQA